ncbi:hypothetical protein [Streptomyces sp. NPDC005969]|uniref:hypothetical protein n=1 Tax=Streptomyces sp. NPDC005969 TaxID=3156722 RepID=UPI0033F0454E
MALEEITDDAMPAYRKVLSRRLTHSVHIGTVALWSRYPITDSERVTIDPGWSRSLRARVQGPDGPLAVYVVHLPSVRVGASGFTIARRRVAPIPVVSGRARQRSERACRTPPGRRDFRNTP